MYEQEALQAHIFVRFAHVAWTKHQVKICRSQFLESEKTSMSNEPGYPIGAPGKKWGEAERAE
jgi:hypothetical protein